MAEVASVSPAPEPEARASNSPPNCAICLGHCINKCYSNSCLHQFCFKCLLEWSKIKPVCPLCQRQFSSIIHNVKSNEEYDQHYVQQNVINDDDTPYWQRGSADLTLPNVAPFSRSFQFRTTLTVDLSGEWAIQQLLSTHSQSRQTNDQHQQHPLFRYVPRIDRLRRFRGDNSSSEFRRWIYENNHWIGAVLHSSFREPTPNFYMENPAAKNRLVPWLNREMNALIPQDSIRAMRLVQDILNAIDHHSIKSRRFRELVQSDMGQYTDHFIHEFYTYARSPYDMVGYDRHTFFTLGFPSIHVSDVESSDSDVYVVPPAPSEVIDISDSSRDSDVVIREPTPPALVDLANTSDSDDKGRVNNPIFPLKLRLKRKKESRKRRRHSYNRSSHTDSSSNETKMRRNERKKSRLKYYIVKDDLNDTQTSSHESSSSDDERREHSRHRRFKGKSKRRKSSKRKSYTPPLPKVEDDQCKTEVAEVASESGDKTETKEVVNGNQEQNWEPETQFAPPEDPYSVAGPSGVYRFQTMDNAWYARPNCCSDDSSD